MVLEQVHVGNSVEIWPDEKEIEELTHLPDGNERVYVIRVQKLWEDAKVCLMV